MSGCRKSSKPIGCQERQMRSALRRRRGEIGLGRRSRQKRDGSRNLGRPDWPLTPFSSMAPGKLGLYTVDVEMPDCEMRASSRSISSTVNLSAPTLSSRNLRVHGPNYDSVATRTTSVHRCRPATPYRRCFFSAFHMFFIPVNVSSPVWCVSEHLEVVRTQIPREPILDFSYRTKVEQREKR